MTFGPYDWQDGILREITSMVCTALGVALQLQLSVASAQEVSAFASICVEADGTGYNWKEGQWNRVGFAEETFVVRKIPVERQYNSDNPEGCAAFSEPNAIEVDDYARVAGCYRRGKLGAKHFSSWCSEFYTKLDSRWELDSISCFDSMFGEKIAFEPSGPFIWYSVNSNVSAKPKDDYKDSLKVSHGQCSVIEN